MTIVQDIVDCLESVAPPSLAESWDNVGLLLGDRHAPVNSILTCLTLTPDVAEEAIASKCQMVVTHHPILFRPVQRLTTDTQEGAMLLKLIAAGVAVYSAHTRYDSAAAGINRQIADRLSLADVRPLRPQVEPSETSGTGGGRFGRLAKPLSLSALLNRVKQALEIDRLQFVGETRKPVTRVAVACGAAAEFLADAARCDCQALITGEARFHACLEARALGLALILPGHYATERFGMESLAKVLSSAFRDVKASASRAENDPIQWS